MSTMPGLRAKGTTSTGRLLLTLALATPIIIWMLWFCG